VPTMGEAQMGCSYIRTVLLIFAFASLASAVRRQDAAASTPAPVAPPAPPISCPPGTPDNCNCLLECCKPGSMQLGDDPNGNPSFCTDKPFQTDYMMRVFEKVPVQINLRDYCTDEILYTSYAAPKVDRFTLVEFQCTYRASDCSLIEDPVGQEECVAGFDVYTKQLNCSGPDSFFEKFVNSRICTEKNAKQSNGKWFWDPGHEALGSSSIGGGGLPATVGSCFCNYTEAIQKKMGKKVYGKIYSETDINNLTVGVPNGFIKDGMSTFYVEVVVGGRSTVERGADKDCMCQGPGDKSDACLCELGSKKIPYVYNNSFVPALTALVSMRKGQLFYTNTFVNFNFDQGGRRGCNGCPPGVLLLIPANWARMCMRALGACMQVLVQW